MSDDLKLVYSGSRTEGLFINEMLNESGIGSIMKDAFQSGIQAGWPNGLPENRLRILVDSANSEKAKALIEEYFATRDKE